MAACPSAADIEAGLRRLAEVSRLLAQRIQDTEIVDVDYEDITDMEEEYPGEEAYCVPI